MVLASAIYFESTDTFFGAGDALTVFFDRAVAEWYGFGVSVDGRVTLAEIETAS